MSGLVLDSLVKEYADFRLDMDFSVNRGELLTLLGPSGCGKTTSLRTIAGFITPDRGRILLEKQPIHGLPPYRRQIGIVFQDYALFPHLNVLQNVSFGPRMQGWSRKRSLSRVRSLLELVHLQGYEQRPVTRLSGGEQQRVALARALAPDPRLLLLDEPLSALDAKLRVSLRREIRRIQRALSVTTVYVTHDQEEALALSDRIAVMRAGRVEQIGTPREVYARPRSLFVAGFIGQANLIPGTLAPGSGEVHGILNTPLGKLAARRHPRTGEGPRQMTLFFRPEHCRLDPPGSRPEGLNRIRGRVIRAEYLGEYRQLEIEAQGLLLVAKANASPDAKASPDIGQSITLEISPDHCWLLESQV